MLSFNSMIVGFLMVILTILDQILLGTNAQISMHTTENTLDPVSLRNKAYLDGVLSCMFVITPSLHNYIQL